LETEEESHVHDRYAGGVQFIHYMFRRHANSADEKSSFLLDDDINKLVQFPVLVIIL